MPTPEDVELARLMAEAATASPADRINYRDPIAAFGTDAIDAMEPWIHDRQTATLAVQVVRQAAASHPEPAVALLRNSLSTVESAITQSDIRDALDSLGVKRATSRRTSVVRESSEPYEAMELEDLEVRGYYVRADLHARGLGGNPQSGISYPAGGDYALLFTNPAREGETGYHDRWVDENEILFYGQWSGAGDMPWNATNRKFVELSPNLYLFTLAKESAYRYEGRLEYVEHFTERAENQGEPANAYVFRLRRVAE